MPIVLVVVIRSIIAFIVLLFSFTCTERVEAMEPIVIPTT
jgi:hypothetical protein